MRTSYCLGFGIVVALIGASLLVALGLLYVKPYVYVRHLEQSSCTMSYLDLTDEAVRCTCTSDGSSSCQSQYPCIKVFVNFSMETGDSVVNATLYDSYETYMLQKNALQCSYHRCDRVAVYNHNAVKSFYESYGMIGLTIVLVFVFCTDGKGHYEGRQLQFPSIERRLAHITERSTAQLGESSHSEKLVPSQYYISDTNDLN